MKFLITIALLATSLSASATSFNKLRSKTKITDNAQTVRFNVSDGKHHQVFLFPLTQVCLQAGEELQPFVESNVCTKYKAKRVNGRLSNHQFDCVKTEKRLLTTSLTYLKRKCVDSYRDNDGDTQCRKYERYEVQYPTTFKKVVRKQYWHGSEQNGSWSWPGRVIQTSMYTVPACK